MSWRRSGWPHVVGKGQNVTARRSGQETTEGPKKIGVLALQGDFREHIEILKKLGAEPVEVRSVEDLERLSGLIVPGGESTAIGNLMVESGLLDGIRSFFYKGGPVWGTCAGMVLAGSATVGPRQPLLGLMNALFRSIHPGAVLRGRGSRCRGTERGGREDRRG